MKYLKIFFSL